MDSDICLGTAIEWVPGHQGIDGIARAKALPGENVFPGPSISGPTTLRSVYCYIRGEQYHSHQLLRTWQNASLPLVVTMLRLHCMNQGRGIPSSPLAIGCCSVGRKLHGSVGLEVV